VPGAAKRWRRARSFSRLASEPGARPARTPALRAGRPRGVLRRVELPVDAARALDAVRRTGQNVRFEVKKACEQERWRLKVLYDAADPATGETTTVALGLLWSDDKAGVTALCDRLARGEA